MVCFGYFTKGNSVVEDGDSILGGIEINIFEAPIAGRLQSVDAHIVDFAFQPILLTCFFAVFQP